MLNFKIIKLWLIVVVVAAAAAVAAFVATAFRVEASVCNKQLIIMNCLSPIRIKNPKPTYYSPRNFIDVPCGKCVHCLKNKRRELSFRIYNELKDAESAYFVTLTYDTPNLQFNLHTGLPILVKRDVQLFLKRLRKDLSSKGLEHRNLKYFCVSEFGDEFMRPHYHMILFNLPIQDTPVITPKRCYYPLIKQYLDSIWQLGFTDVGGVTLASCNYCAKYVCKGLFDLDKKPWVQEYWTLRSQGIGLNFVDRHGDRFLRSGKTFTTWHSFPIKLPRYYINKIFYNNESDNFHQHCRLSSKAWNYNNTSGHDSYSYFLRAANGQYENAAILFSEYQNATVNNVLRASGGFRITNVR